MPPLFDGGPSTIERSAYILLKNNCTLSSGRHHRAPVGALASELGLFDGHETALANALVAATYQAIADGERDAGAVCRAMGLVSQLANASASSVTAWPHEAAECIDATRRMTESQRMTRLQFFLEDGVVTAADIREKTLVLSKQESWLSIDCDRWWLSINRSYRGDDASGNRLVCVDDVVRTQHGVLCVPIDVGHEHRCCRCQRIDPVRMMVCSCLNSRTCPSCAADGFMHNCPAIYECVAPAATALSARFLPICVFNAIVLPVTVEVAFRFFELGVLLPDGLTSRDVESILAYPGAVLLSRRNAGKTRERHEAREAALVAEFTCDCPPTGATGKVSSCRPPTPNLDKP